MSFSIGCAKCLIIVFNIVYAILGIALLSLGVIFLNEDAGKDEKILEVVSYAYNVRTVGSILFVVSGIVIILFALLGCFGAIKEGTRLLKTFACVLIIFAIVQIVICVFAFVASNNKNSLEDYQNSMREVFMHYGNDTKVQQAFDYVQKQYRCCGVVNHLDYNDVHSADLPATCCIDRDPCYNFDKQYLLKTGCAEKELDKVSFFLKTVGAISTVVGIFEIIGALVAYYLANTIQNELRRRRTLHK